MHDSEEFLDPYLDPETGILRNLIGVWTKKSLEDAEGSLSFARLVQLMDRPPKPTGDLAELRAIHRHLFQDLYAWHQNNARLNGGDKHRTWDGQRCRG